MSEHTVDAVCIIGTGLIGGSLALALRQAGFCREIIGAGRTEETLIKAAELGVIDRYDTHIPGAVEHADIVVVCVPLGAMRAVFEQIDAGRNEHTIVTDAGSAKQSVIDDAHAVFGSDLQYFVAGHPIAGTEQSGVGAAFPELYQQRRVILTPTEETNTDALDRVRTMWQAAGAVVETMSAEHHDLVLAGTSHLPHLLAFGLVDCLNNLEDIDEIFRFAAGGFRDFTRIASSDPIMWRDICLSNRVQVMAMMKRYRDEMVKVYRALEDNDGEKLKEVFERAKRVRDAFCG
ncbi:MAG: prephenate dehydrogenase/arogenate dehydrogenase family protein [Gammaproteobacteria bacterium]|nr:prephenate dehydrogenase/arogenate dehydrogenase family protein [Gammaproteobacteria bacterium]